MTQLCHVSTMFHGMHLPPKLSPQRTQVEQTTNKTFFHYRLGLNTPAANLRHYRSLRRSMALHSTQTVGTITSKI